MSEVESTGVARIGFEGERDNLVTALAWLVKGVRRRMSVPVLAGVLVTAEADHTVTLTTFDYEVQRTVRLDGTTVTAPGRVLVGATDLHNIVKGLPKGTKKAPAPSVKFAGNGGTLTVLSGEALFNVDTMPVEDYPATPAAPVLQGSIDAAVFAAAIASVAVAAGKDETLPILTGVMMHAMGDGTFTLDTTDRYRLASFDGTWTPMHDECEVTALIPAGTLAEVGKLFAKRGGLVMIGRNDSPAHNDGAVSLSWGDGSHYVHTRILDGEFPKVRNLYPDQSAYIGRAVVDPALVLPVVASIATSLERNEPARLTFDGSGRVTVSSAKSTASAKADYDGEPVTMAFNHSFLSDGLKAAGTRVQIGMTAAKKPAIMRQVDADGNPVDGYRHLLMPVRIGDRPPAPAPAATPAVPEPAPAPEPVAETTPVDEIVEAVAAETAARDAAVAAAEPEPVAEATPEPEPEPEPEPVAEPEPVVETAWNVTPAADARIAEILRTGTWGTAVVKVGKGRERKPVGVDVLKLNAGRLNYQTEYLPVSEVVGKLGGAWNKAADGFVFEPARAQFSGGYSRSGAERLTAWLARNAPTLDAVLAAEVNDNAAVALAAAMAAPVVETTPEPEPAAPVAEPEPEPAPVAEPEPAGEDTGTATITATVPAKRGPFDAVLTLSLVGDEWQVTGTKGVRFTAPKAWKPIGFTWNGTTAWVKPHDGEATAGMAVRLAAALAANGVPAVVSDAPGTPVVRVAPVAVPAAPAPAPAPAPVTYRIDPTAPVTVELDPDSGRKVAAWKFTTASGASFKGTAQEVRTLTTALVTRPVNKGRGAPGVKDTTDSPVNWLKLSTYRDTPTRTLTVRAFLPTEGDDLDLAALAEKVIETTLEVPGVAALTA